MTISGSPEILRKLAVSNGVDEAASCLSKGVNEVVGPDWNVMDSGQATWERLAAGVERLGKFTLGLHTAAEEGAFPAKGEMRGSGHDVGRIAKDVTDTVAEWARKKNKPYIERLAVAVKADRYWADVLETLTTAADANLGRYRAQNEAGGTRVEGDPPRASWEEAEFRASTDLGRSADLLVQEHGKILIEARELLAHSILRWWQMVYRAWQNGFCGEDAKAFAAQISCGMRWVQSADLQAWVRGL